MVPYANAWQYVRGRIARAATATGRPPDSIGLVAVSKTFPPSAIRAVYALGQRAFGENYVQEALDKMDALPDLTDVEWHLIGPLQSNKTKVVAERFQWVETVDRIRIAERLADARPAGMQLIFYVLVLAAIGASMMWIGKDGSPSARSRATT